MPSSITTGSIALDGTPNNTVNNATTSNVITLTTTKTNDIVVVITYYNFASTATTVVDTAGLVWTRRAEGGSSSNWIDEWTAPSTGALTGDTITISYTGGNNFNVAVAFAVNGTNFASPYDAGGPQQNAAPSLGITTTSANGLIFGGCRSNASADTVGAGWTGILSGVSGSFGVVEYQLGNAATYSLTTAANNGNGCVADSVHQ